MGEFLCVNEHATINASSLVLVQFFMIIESTSLDLHNTLPLILTKIKLFYLRTLYKNTIKHNSKLNM